MMHKKARKEFSEDKQLDYWYNVLWSHETKINLFGSDGVKRVWRQPGEEYKNKCVLPDLNPIEHLWGILKRKVEERKVSNIHQLRDVVMEEWIRTPGATCEALVNSMPKINKTVLENNGGHTKYWHFGPNLDIFT